MKILLLSDVHGNLPALETLFENESCDARVFLGDAVNYGPWQNECVDLINGTCDVILQGNHEWDYVQGVSRATGLAARFFEFCYPKFDRMNEISLWDNNYSLFDFLLSHTYDDQVIYPDSSPEFDYNYIIGHSHHQSIHRCGDHYLYSVGSVGQNRQFINRIDYAVMIDGVVTLRNMTYDEKIIINKMRSMKYPAEFINYYSKKGKV